MDINYILKDLGISKAELARRAGISAGNLNATLKNPTEETVRKISKALNVPVGVLFGDDERKEEGTAQTIRFNCPHCGKTIEVKVKG